MTLPQISGSQYVSQEFTLSVQSNTFSVNVPFTPRSITILNNTSNPVYINRSASIPGSTPGTYNYVIPGATSQVPAQNVLLPTASYSFAGFLPLTPTLTDTTQVVTVIISGYLNLKKN